MNHVKPTSDCIAAKTAQWVFVIQVLVSVNQISQQRLWQYPYRTSSLPDHSRSCRPNSQVLSLAKEPRWAPEPDCTRLHLGAPADYHLYLFVTRLPSLSARVKLRFPPVSRSSRIWRHDSLVQSGAFKAEIGTPSAVQNMNQLCLSYSFPESLLLVWAWNSADS